MRLSLYLFTFIFICPFLLSCGVCTSKKYACDANLDTDFKAWFPLDSGKQFIYKYNTSFDTVTILPYQKSTSQTASSGGSGKTIPCYTRYTITSLEKDSANKNKLILYTDLETYYPGKNSSYQATLTFRKSSFNFYSYNIPGEIEANNATITSQSNYTFGNGIIYDSIFIAQKDTTMITQNTPYKMYLVKTKGIVAYEYYPSHALWVIQ